MFELYDVVTITIDQPKGGTKGHKNLVGVITNVSDEEFYEVTDVVGDSYYYIESELRPVGVRELENAFVTVVRKRIYKV